jgi:peptide chain release factor 1
MRGTGPGGQNRNKIESACRIHDHATGISAYADCRTREASYRMALAELEKRIAQAKADAQAKVRKDRRDVAIHDHTIVRTYNFSRGLVKDHRSGKEATVKEILGKGRLDLLR